MSNVGFSFELVVKDIVISPLSGRRQAVINWRCGCREWNNLHVERGETLTVHKDLYLWYGEGDATPTTTKQHVEVYPTVKLKRFSKDDVYFEWFKQNIKVHKGERVEFWVPLTLLVDSDRVTHEVKH